MKDLLIATGNRGKLEEIKFLLKQNGILDIKILSKADFPDLNLSETGVTYEENALSKAKTAAQVTGTISLADDSGLEVEALNWGPGPMSARFAGKNAKDSTNVKKLLSLLADLPEQKRRAKFVCVVAVCSADGKYHTAQGEIYGKIATSPKGKNGFGYDPVFMPDGYDGLTFAQMSDKDKNTISHRAAAIKNISPLLKSMLGLQAP